MSDTHKYLTAEQLHLIRELNANKVVICLLDEIQAYQKDMALAVELYHKAALKPLGEIPEEMR